MAKTLRDPNQVLDAARQAVATARLGVDDYLKGDTGTRRMAGMRNAIVWGHSVIRVLQHLRTFDRGGFSKWYGPKEAELMANPDFKYLHELRNQIIHEGSHGATTSSALIEHFNSGDIDFSRAPANTKGFFVGDSLGGSGWEVELADGTTEKFYAALPATARVTTWAQFATQTAGEGLPTPEASIAAVLQRYLDYLSGLVADADVEFGHR